MASAPGRPCCFLPLRWQEDVGHTARTLINRAVSMDYPAPWPSGAILSSG
jgi:hypothetical protein